MKYINRVDHHPIIKKELNQKDFIDYNELNIKLLNELINDTIENYNYNTFDLITLLRKNCSSNLMQTIKSIEDFKNVRFNCYYASKILKEKLDNIGLDSKYLSYKSIGFSSITGDNLIKEAHMSLFIPTKKDQRNHYIIMDPGYRIPEVLEFPEKDNKKILIDNDIIEIAYNDKLDYPYSMKMEGYNRYSPTRTSYECTEYFDINYETVNQEQILFPISYELLTEYRLIKYSQDKTKRGFIKINILDSYLECLIDKAYLYLSFQEIKELSYKELEIKIKPYLDTLGENSKEFLENIIFIINYQKEFLNNIINSNVIKEKQNIKKI